MDDIVSVGLINGRHKMPVDTFIFESIPSDKIHDYEWMRKVILDFVWNNVGIKRCYGQAINEAEATDVVCFMGVKKLNLYVTGLTGVTAEAISVCLRNGVDLTLMNYNTETNTYVPQRV